VNCRLSELFHQIGELGEQIVRIVRAGRGFRMILHAEEGQGLVAHASLVLSFKLICVISTLLDGSDWDRRKTHDSAVISTCSVSRFLTG